MSVLRQKADSCFTIGACCLLVGAIALTAVMLAPINLVRKMCDR